MAKILDGKALSAQIRADLKVRLNKQIENGMKHPFLTVMQVGDDLPSTVYVRAKQRACEEIGLGFRHYKLPAETSIEQLRDAVKEVNNDPSVHGLLVQSPLPPHLDEIEVQRLVSPLKDVDCFHPENVGLLYIGRPRFQPCTAAGIIEMLMAYDCETSGKNVVIIGRSVIVGKPLALIMMLKGRGGNATVTVCHSRTKNLSAVARQADILIPAVGIPEMVKADWVKEGAVVVDVGINRVPDSSKKRGYRLVGDVAFKEVEPKVSAIAPVPGGVGPMTVAILAANVMRAAGLKVQD
ncbi:MAG: bifunctional 5,10-methylenetetrahydrofolate dehydrogenase/5,10-methenyltetrahydrofolate cyclohydrolase [Calditrichaeota bacterium]|nr:bifunctional 5,10-methylenetetrahydrofolate dehydrogenase/5,10-methenyltetrahydrofolate cyclohydrolase [Calditrichota bacterium]